MTNRRDALGALGSAGFGLLGVSILPTPLLARDQLEVTMRNVDPDDPGKRMVFTPDLLKVPPGSQVRFRVLEGAHSTQSTPGMVPEGAKGWRFGIRKSGTVTLSRPGFYGYHCLPHRSMGMVGLIMVQGIGMMENLQSAMAVNHPAKAAQTWADLWQRALALI